MPYLDNARAVAAELHTVSEAESKPCSQHEVERLERRLGRPVPAAYREFLLWMGHGAGDFLAGTDAFYPDLANIQEWAAALLSDDDAALQLPEDALVILMHQGYQFCFVRLSEGDDPPVYYYMEDSRPETFTRTDEHYSDFLVALIEA